MAKHTQYKKLQFPHPSVFKDNLAITAFLTQKALDILFWLSEKNKNPWMFTF